MTKVSLLLEEIDSLARLMEERRPFSAALERRIFSHFRIEWDYHSNSIEGNSLTYGETKGLLLHGITAGGKPLRDALEIKGHDAAITMLLEIVRQRTPLTEHTIRELHRIILPEPYELPALSADGKEIRQLIARGEYKQHPNHVRTATGEIFYFAEPFEVASKMNDLVAEVNKRIEAGTEHPLVQACLAHYSFVLIHPFDDGNGRMARLLLNLILMMHSLPPAVLPVEEKSDYYRTLREADAGNLTPFTEFVAGHLLRSLRIMRDAIEKGTIDDSGSVARTVEQLKKDLRN